MDIIPLLQQDPGIWDLFTRKEEYDSSIRDQYDRFPYFMSRYRNIFEPSASKYLTEHGYRVEYPEDKPFAVCLTHDTDILYKTAGTKIYEALGNLRSTSLSSLISLLTQIRSKKIPWWNFSDITALEDRYDAKSSFYFMVQDSGDLDYNYDIEDCEEIIGELSDNENEIGLHGGHSAYTNPDEIKEKKQRLEKVLNKHVVGYRNHYLRFRIPDTWEHLQNAGFLYDTTLGYSDCIGFRNGMCHPFRPYNLTTQREIDILEIPLTIMDRTFSSYMKLDAKDSWEITKRLIDVTEQFHGVISVLWHNQEFFGEQGKFYEKILHYCSEKGAWMTSGKEIAMWMDKNR